MTPFGPAVAAPPDTMEAGWLLPRLGAFGTVGGLIPSGFERYVAVDHSTAAQPEGWVLAAELLATLSEVASAHTTTPDRAWFAIWEGHGWDCMTRVYGFGPDVPPDVVQAERARLRNEDEARNAQLRGTLAALPAFDLPHRRYLLVTGPVDAAHRIDSPSGHGTQSPDLWWPDDRAWFVATDTDLTWSYVGGTAALAEEVLAAFAGRSRPVAWDAWNAEALG